MDRFRPFLAILAFLFASPVLGAGEAAGVLGAPNSVAVELLGKGFIGSFSYERNFSERFGAGTGLGFFPGQLGDSSNALMVPVYGSYHFTDDHRGAYVFGGIDVMLVYPYGGGNGNFVGFVDQQVVPIWGIGYENRGDNGLFFRIGVNFFIILPWPGLTLGWSF